MKIRELIGLAAVTAITMFAQEGKSTYEASPDRNKIVGGERDFVNREVQYGMLQIEAAKLAEARASTDQVKKMASKMDGDQTKITSDLRTVVGEKNWTLGATNKSDRGAVELLKGLHGRQFDQAYIKLVLDRKQQQARSVTQEAENGKDPDLRSYAQRTKAMLEDHIQVLKDVQQGKH